MQPFLNIAKKIAEEIKTGAYIDTLPSISRLSKQFNVCPATVKRILAQLRDWNLVNGEHGRCVRVNPKAAGNIYFHKNVVILADLSTIATPFFAKTLESLTDELNSINICVHVFLSVNQVQECAFRPECAITVNHRSQIIEDALRNHFPDCPVVRLNCPSERFPYVMSDGHKAGYEAMRHLAEDCGHTHIGVLATQLKYTRDSFRLRYDGALDYGRRHPQIQLSMVEIPELELCSQTGFRLMKKMMQEDPSITAIFATCDMLALSVYSYAATHRLRIPDDLTVIGFDNENFSLVLSPQLTTLSENAQSTSEHLFKIVCDLLTGRKTEPVHLTDPLLIVRGSTQVKSI
ncbi:MAG: LacI family DNA-binding transcriptional regulator [Lentisphaeria bacterium]|nr:LacI family DNA-binding transcriptional regulator [Lentisphaeria bacterium]